MACQNILIPYKIWVKGMQEEFNKNCSYCPKSLDPLYIEGQDFLYTQYVDFHLQMVLFSLASSKMFFLLNKYMGFLQTFIG